MPGLFDSALRSLDSSVRPEIVPNEAYLTSINTCFEVLIDYMRTPPGYPGSRQFMESPLFPVWKNLLALLKTRVGVLDSWEGVVSSMACDNLLCGKTKPKREFKRCVGCLSADYCCSDYQSDDWRDGHRAVCDDLRTARYRVVSSEKHTTSFVGYSMCDILFMRKHPGEEYVIIFDYARPDGVRFMVDHKYTLQGEAHLEVELPGQWARLARSRAHGDAYNLPQNFIKNSSHSRDQPRFNQSRLRRRNGTLNRVSAHD
ncbi:hypothetical protein B0H19DRAFT_1310763 [Mycena capillaripes]|nr:hypothetical protein B0H19DRAFT_1310763 [Mycena capillaripes]